MADIHTRGPAELRRAPLDHLRETLASCSTQAPTQITLQEQPFSTQIGLRAMPGTAAHRALADATGVGLPAQVGEVRGGPDGVGVLWLAPDEFLVVAPPDGHPLLAVALEAALGDAPGQVVDLSANRTIIEVRGAQARSLLEKGVPADLHPRALPPGSAVATTLSTVPVLLWRTELHSFRLMPRASFADYVARWLLDAAREHRPASLSDHPEEVSCPATVG
ncbi:sarcosine oxidase subunit gamma [Nesterenkonia sp. HG001]|uniref:sarcosine oxidase subunit gamma n=1 Tax=Nesterenkonia sp. HG001 TaxID=2983207 RepID=UPI002AC5AB6B|nr:sarcosine oxidase subunit gamma family protein [Nesterenkonia sp. HG001]MDZ5078657.1 sarcosine oxidase subunit gamma family protein [Nesterenkonia sp. HG001]